MGTEFVNKDPTTMELSQYNLPEAECFLEPNEQALEEPEDECMSELENTGSSDSPVVCNVNSPARQQDKELIRNPDDESSEVEEHEAENTEVQP